jgi:2-oxoisovalerate dehydrogenase E1 component alpha subunit
MTSPDRKSFRVPRPNARPGEPPDFSWLTIPSPLALDRPPLDAPAARFREHADGLVRVLDDDGVATGAWNPQLEPETLRDALRAMLLTRAFDERMFKLQRQGKITFYIKSTGEEAVACGQALALDPGDMCFTSYRQQGLLIMRDYPLTEMINQIFNNAADPLKGRQLPILYSSRKHGFYSLSGNVGSRFPHAVGWAMANAARGEPQVAAAWIGDGTTAEGEFHYALTFAGVYRAPVILNVVNNQWAISTFQGIAGGLDATFAARGLGYGLPSLRVDGNDLLAVYAATRWARERAMAGHGATLIELLTYRTAQHSTSDDPTRYRPADEASAWPLGDPLDRLRAHLERIGEWSGERHAQASAAAASQVAEALQAAQSVGTFGRSRPPLSTLFEDIFETPDWRLRDQAAEVVAQ